MCACAVHYKVCQKQPRTTGATSGGLQVAMHLPWTQPLIYFWCGTAARAGRQELVNLKFQYRVPTRQRFSGVSGPNYTKFWEYVEPSSMLLKFKNGEDEDILLSFQTTAAQTRALLSIRPNFALFDPSSESEVRIRSLDMDSGSRPESPGAGMRSLTALIGSINCT